MKARTSVAVCVVFFALACRSEAKPSAYTALDASSEALRAKFNQDADKTRVLMLVAPT